MSATAQDVSALEHLAYRIREDTHGLKPWDRAGTHVIFQRELTGIHLMTAIDMVVRHAADPEAKTPAAITRPFLPDAPKPKPANWDQVPPRERDYCTEHPNEPPPPHCRIHATEPAAAWYDADTKTDAPPGTPEYRIAAGLTPKHQEVTQ